MTKLLFLLGARSEWGYIEPLLSGARELGWDVELCVTNLILLPQNRNLLAELESSGYEISHRIFSGMAGDTTTSMAKSVGLVTLGFVDAIGASNPDWVVLAGDRVEQLGAAVASSTMYVPTAHIQGGERSGNIDGVNRHAISKLSHLHFASNQDAYDRLVRMGEEEWRVELSGAPQLDSLLSTKALHLEELLERRLVGSKEFILAVMHGVTEDRQDFTHLKNILNSLEKCEETVTWILPNNDAGGQLFADFILQNKRRQDFAFSNVSRDEYVSLMSHARFLIGNSSSGLLEAPSLGLPAINVGSRQADRVFGLNVIHSDGSMHSLREAITRVKVPDFRKSLAARENPYGDGKATPKILNKLDQLKTREGLTVKKISY